MLAKGAVKTDRGGGSITGEIIGRDHFGNLRTNIEADSLRKLYGKDASTARVSVKGKTIIGVQEAYDAEAPGEILAIIGSRGFLEIAVNRGDAARILDAVTGDTVSVDRSKT